VDFNWHNKLGVIALQIHQLR